MGGVAGRRRIVYNKKTAVCGGAAAPGAVQAYGGGRRKNMSFRYCPLYSGSSGNAALLSTGRISLLVDAGLTGKAIVAGLKEARCLPESLSGILITHEHSDHIKGAGVLSRKYDLPIYGQRPHLGGDGEADWGGGARNVRIFETGHEFILGDIAIMPYSIPHDAAEPVGYSFFHRGCKVSQMTDLGHITAEVLQNVAGIRPASARVQP